MSRYDGSVLGWFAEAARMPSGLVGLVPALTCLGREKFSIGMTSAVGAGLTSKLLVLDAGVGSGENPSLDSEENDWLRR